MPYPFARAPRTGEVISQLSTLGAALCELPESVVGPRGAVKIRYMERILDDGSVVHSEPLAEDDTDPVGWDKLRRVCNQLQVDPRDLEIPGLHLGLPP